MLYRSTMAAAVLVTTLLALAACGGPSSGGAPTSATSVSSGAKSIVVSATEFKFDPPDQTFKAGEKVKISLTNKGAVIHTWILLGADGKEIIKLKADPGKTDAKEFTAPAAGSYQIVCDEAGHKESGMVGKATVQ
ncbi:MAG: cupredoxin domain-containing protein [Chloroflexi bacterium]|nr:cupredoxin domain-containing protein [Chloroflexota bacterium]